VSVLLLLLLLPPPPMRDFVDRRDMVLPKRPLLVSAPFPLSESCFEDLKDMDMARPSLLVDSSPAFFPAAFGERRDNILLSPLTPDLLVSPSDRFDRRSLELLDVLAMLRRLIARPALCDGGGGGIRVASNWSWDSRAMPGDWGGERRMVFGENIVVVFVGEV
jgi:hypothetical protein